MKLPYDGPVGQEKPAVLDHDRLTALSAEDRVGLCSSRVEQLMEFGIKSRTTQRQTVGQD